MPPGVCTIRRKLPPYAVPNSGSPPSNSGPATRRPPDHHGDSYAPRCSEEETLRAAASAPDCTSHRHRPPTWSCTFRSLATGRGEIPARRGNFLSLWRLRRNPAIGRIHNHRRARTGVLEERNTPLYAPATSSSVRAPHAVPTDQRPIAACPIRSAAPRQSMRTNTLAEAQRTELDKQRSALVGRDRRVERGTELDVAGAYNGVFPLPQHTGARTSMIVDPPNGRIPAQTPELRKCRRRAGISPRPVASDRNVQDQVGGL